MKNTNENLISVKQAADILGYSRVHLARLIKSGKIPAKKVGRSYVIDKQLLSNIYGGIFREITDLEADQIKRAMERVIEDFEPALRKLGKE